MMYAIWLTRQMVSAEEAAVLDGEIPEPVEVPPPSPDGQSLTILGAFFSSIPCPFVRATFARHEGNRKGCSLRSSAFARSSHCLARKVHESQAGAPSEQSQPGLAATCDMKAKFNFSSSWKSMHEFILQPVLFVLIFAFPLSMFLFLSSI
jgi:hypothetical protein